MLGEFYDRTVTGLLSLDPFLLRHAQLYLHLYRGDDRILDSQRLLLSALSENEIHSLERLWTHTPCQCLQRAIFCGYDKEEKSKQSSADGVAMDYYKPGGSVMPGNGLGSHIFAQTRQLLRERLIESQPHVLRDVHLFRQQLLQEHGYTAHDKDSVKIVGLTQRSGRRRWLNLQDVMDQLSNIPNVIFHELNVETLHAYDHLIHHAAMDALIGIHGAQLTEGILLHDNAWILELLPYVPDYIIMGAWTRTTHTPTPLGHYFDETALNHAGYLLERESAPYCLEDDDPTCWGYSKSPWDDRNFNVNPDIVETFVKRLVVGKEEQRRCADLQRAAANQFVLYNVICQDGSSKKETPSVHHFYWKKPKE